MKKILLGILLPVLTLITLIGTGFATWYFNDDLSSTKSVTTNVEVTSVAKIGSVQLRNTEVVFELDQPSGNNSGIRFLHVASGYSAMMYADYKAPVLNTGEVIPKNVKFEVKVTFTQAQKLYVGMKTDINKWHTGDYGLTYYSFITFDGKTDQTISLYGTDFRYIKEPKNLEEYQAMKTAFMDPIKIEVSASYV